MNRRQLLALAAAAALPRLPGQNQTQVVSRYGPMKLSQALQAKEILITVRDHFDRVARERGEEPGMPPDCTMHITRSADGHYLELRRTSPA